MALQFTEDERKEMQGVLSEIVDDRIKDYAKGMDAKINDLRDMTVGNFYPGESKTSKEDASNLMELAGLMKAAYRHARYKDERGFKEFGGIDEVMKTDMLEGTGSQGGYLVPTEMENTVLRIAAESSLFMGRTRKVGMTSKTKTVPALNTPPSVAWHTEGEEMTQTSPTLDEVNLTAYRLDAYCTISNELLEDSRVNIATWLAQEFTEAMAKEVDYQIFNGSGAPCSGILTDSAGYSVVMDTGNTHFSAITPTYLSEMMSKMDSTALAGAFFALHQTVAHYLRTLTDDNGRYLVDLSDGRLWGLPVYTRDVCPSTSGADTAFVALCNPKYFLTGLRHGGMRIDLDPYTHFTTNKTNIRVIWRMALNIGKAAAFVRLLTAAS